MSDFENLGKLQEQAAKDLGKLQDQVAKDIRKLQNQMSEQATDELKLDVGKYMAGIIEEFLPALKEIAELGSMNNKPNGKYERGSWKNVENAETRYLDAWWRHVLDGRHNIDPESGKPHDVAIAWNSLALLMFRLKREGKI